MTASPPVQISVVVPAYNEAGSIASALDEIATALDRLGRTWEIVVVDDGSTDETVRAAQAAAPKWPHLRVVENHVNLGIGGALRRGAQEAAGDFITIVPVDIAFDLSRLGDMMDAMADADVLVCLRSDRQDSSLFRKAVSHVYIAAVQRLFGLPLRQFNYIHVYRRCVFERAMFESNGVFFHAEVLIRARDAGLSLKEFPLEYRPRRIGQAKGARLGTIFCTFGDLARFWLDWPGVPANGSGRVIALETTPDASTDEGG